MHFLIQSNPLNPAPHRDDLLRLDAGGYCAFEGWVRNHHLGKGVRFLDYQAYGPLALKEGNRILQQALDDFDILGARAIHRTGQLNPGELAVWIGVTAIHRNTAFEACRHIIDAIKETVPIWKHEFYTDNTDIWVDPTSCQCHSHTTPVRRSLGEGGNSKT